MNVTKETVQSIVDGIEREGLGYWLQNYSEVKNDGTDLDGALAEAVLAVTRFEAALLKYKMKFGFEI